MRIFVLLGLSCLLWPCRLYSQTAQSTTQSTALQTSPWRAQFVSSRIDALRKQVASGSSNTDGFWKDIAGIGTPLIEPSKSGDRHQLITFVWRGKPDTRNVVVAWQPFVHLRPADYFMTHLSGTDVWYLSMRVPNSPGALVRSRRRAHSATYFSRKAMKCTTTSQSVAMTI